MTKTSETIVFFGSGPVAAASLELLAKHTAIEAVITKPQPSHHRETFPVLAIAEKLGIPTYTPNSKQELSELFASKPVTSKLGIVIDYGFIINQDVIDYFPLGIINSHFSVLPEWRGADPISFAILSGQAKTGVSLMVIDAGLDTGTVICTKGIAVEPTDTTPSLTERLVVLSDQLLAEYLPRYLRGDVKPRQQSHPDRATYSRKLTKEDGVLDWHKPATQLEREVRAFIEWPKSRTTIGNKEAVITKSHVIDGTGTPGVVWREGKKFGIYTANGIFVIDALKPAGKPEMTAEAFLAGYGKNL